LVRRVGPPLLIRTRKLQAPTNISDGAGSENFTEAVLTSCGRCAAEAKGVMRQRATTNPTTVF